MLLARSLLSAILSGVTMSEQQTIHIVVSSLTLLFAVGFVLLFTLPRFRRFAHWPGGVPMSLTSRFAFCGFWFYGAFVFIAADHISGRVAIWMIPIGMIWYISGIIDKRKYRKQMERNAELSALANGASPRR